MDFSFSSFRLLRNQQKARFYIMCNASSTIYLRDFDLYNFNYHLSIFTMADNFATLKRVKFYEFYKNSYWLSFVYNKQLQRSYLDITCKLTYKDGQTIENFATTYVKVIAATELVKQLSGAYQYAKNFQKHQGVNIYILLCLIFKILYLFQHKRSASDCVKLREQMREDLINASANAVTNLSRVFVNGCGLSRVGADLQRFINVKNEA